MKNYGKINVPLTFLLKKDAFQWSNKVIIAFDELKAAMTITLVLALPDFDKTFVIEVDASAVRIRAILMHDGRPLTYTSKALFLSHLKMTIYDKEMFTIVHAVAK